MPDLSELPLEQLLYYCTTSLPCDQPTAAAAWQELLQRAVAGNHAAWDALVALLWPSVLGWIYERRPDVAPAVATQVAQVVIAHALVRQQHSLRQRVHLSVAALATDLQQQIRQMLASGL